MPHTHSTDLERIAELLDEAASIIRDADQIASNLTCIEGGTCGIQGTDQRDMERGLAALLDGITDTTRIADLSMHRERETPAPTTTEGPQFL